MGLAYKVCIFLFFAGLSSVLSANSDVIVLVHGLAGSSLTFEYRKELEESGLRTIAVDINPYASNYDRAAELFAQLKGLRTDYGFCHTQANEGHLQFGPDFRGKGLYPEWGADNPVHFVGHSLGGTTIRTLETLLAYGNDCAEDRGELFVGGHDWITSVTTLASPMDGTTIFEHVPISDFLLQQRALTPGFLDFLAPDFPMWGLKQEEGESFVSYWARLLRFGLFAKEDFSVFDLSVEGAKKFNDANQQTYPGRYYFSYALEMTDPVEVDCQFLRGCDVIEKPQKGMGFALKFTGRIIGKQADPIDRANDGIVNQNRAMCPGKKDCKMIDFDVFDFEPEVWQVIKIGFVDHLQVNARDEDNDEENFLQSSKRIYLRIGATLQSLPSKASRSEEELFQASEKAARVRRYLDAMEFLSSSFIDEEEHSESVDVVFAMFSVCLFAVAFVGATMIGKKRFLKRKMKSKKAKASKDGAVVKATL